eukprot:g5397.t1
MSKNPFDDDWVPAQVKQPEIIDLRAVAYGPRGFKLKNKDKFGKQSDVSNLMDIDSTEDTPSIQLSSTSSKSNKLGIGKISKRCWKSKGKPACSLKLPHLSRSLEEIESERQSKKRFRQAKKDIKEARATRLKEIRERRERAEERKKLNQTKGATVQKISNPRTLKKMMKSKKQRQKLMMSSD